LLLNWLLRKLLRRLRKRLKKKRELERLLSLLLIDNSLLMKRQLLPRRHVSHRKHRSRKQLELLLNKLPKKLQLISLLLSLKLINREQWLLKQQLRRLKELHWLQRELLN
jgi:hypothetical protein